MFIVIEFDRSWTVGIDWFKSSKGIRLGFVAIHIVSDTFEGFVGKISEAYHQEKLGQE
jgi:hypothetical protein